ncbi:MULTISPECIES: UDP-N-acetylmuramate dehydrogenase [Anaerofustis]|uniref:UDP-N-acetylmuramate dehydrogenase n=1 Tax=Anaerofustis TaxID=264995 RepID=UPI001106D501|nr:MULTISPECIES: UDP-N-acetylmuramate dehydrogenase [Anaerofustis]MCO8193795.1 UDP-N-acetylmuramate dehydrogenase [Anaerofustis sp. NSJ-163]
MINTIFVEEIKKIVGEENVLLNEPMKKHTTFRSGGEAELYINVLSSENLVELIKYLKEHNIEYSVLGRGSNVLVKDGGIDSVVISTSMMKNLSVKDNIIEADAGVSLALIANEALKNELEGFEFASCIPGSLGGGVFMNAGAHGGELKDVLVDVTVFDGKDIKVLLPDELDLSYRHSNVEEKGYVVLSARIKLRKGDTEKIKNKMAENKEYRVNAQPMEPSAGSTFKRPEGYIAAKLIDDAGLKGFHVGDAYVSEKHAGFIVNKNKAKSRDILEVIDYVKKEVYNKYNVMLEEEVRIIGKDS